MRIRILIAFVALFCYCTKKVTKPTINDSSIRTIDVLSAPDTVINSLSYLASDIEYIPLKTPKNLRFKGIFKIVSNSDKIFINTGNDLICFDNEGQFLYNLYKANPEKERHFSFIYDFDISSDGRTLVVLSTDRIVIFDNKVTGFVFKKSIILKRPWPFAIDLVPETNKMLLSIKSFKESRPSLFLLMGEDGDTLFYRTNWFIYGRSFGLGEEIIRYKTEDYLCFKEPLRDVVLYVDKDSNYFRPRLILDSQGKNYVNLVKREGIYHNTSLNEYSFLNNIFEVSGYIFYNYSYYYLNVNNSYGSPFSRSRSIIFNSISNIKAEIALAGVLRDDLCGGPDFKIQSGGQGKLYSFVNASSLKRHTESETFANAEVQSFPKKVELKRLADMIKDSDNPVLIVLTLKKQSQISDF